MNKAKAGKVVKAAMKNMSRSITNVDSETLQSVLNETRVKLVPLNDFTNNDVFGDYMVSYREGRRINTMGGLSYEEFPNNDVVVNILSKRYELLQHEDVLENVTSVLDSNGIGYDVSKLYFDQRHGSNKLYAMLTLKDIKVDVDGSAISPSIDIFNSTDGSLAAGILFGAYRFKCANGMLLGSTYGLEKVIHSPSAIQKLSFEKMFEDIKGEFFELQNAIERMQKIKFEENMLTTLKKLNFNSMFVKHYDHILEMYMLENNEDVKKDTAWAVYATATNYISNYIMLKSVREGIIQQRIINKFRDSLLTQ